MKFLDALKDRIELIAAVSAIAASVALIMLLHLSVSCINVMAC